MKSLLCKPEDLCWIPSTHIKTLEGKHSPHNPSAEKVEAGRFLALLDRQLSQLVSFNFNGDPVSENKVVGSWDQHSRLSSVLLTQVYNTRARVRAHNQSLSALSNFSIECKLECRVVKARRPVGGSCAAWGRHEQGKCTEDEEVTKDEAGTGVCYGLEMKHGLHVGILVFNKMFRSRVLGKLLALEGSDYDLEDHQIGDSYSSSVTLS